MNFLKKLLTPGLKQLIFYASKKYCNIFNKRLYFTEASKPVVFCHADHEAAGERESEEQGRVQS